MSLFARIGSSDAAAPHALQRSRKRYAPSTGAAGRNVPVCSGALGDYCNAALTGQEVGDLTAYLTGISASSERLKSKRPDECPAICMTGWFDYLRVPARRLAARPSKASAISASEAGSGTWRPMSHWSQIARASAPEPMFSIFMFTDME